MDASDELDVEQIEAELAAAVLDHRRAQWRAHVGGAMPPLPPPELVARGQLARLSRLLARGPTGATLRRLQMMARAVRRARVDADPQVARKVARILATPGAPDGDALAALARARNRAAGGEGFGALLLRDEELTALPGLPPSPAHEPAREDRRSLPPVDAVRDYLARRGLDPGEVAAAAAVSARCVAIDPPREVGISMDGGRGDAAIRRLAHEVGHLFAGRRRAADAPWPLADAPTRGIAEGVAEWFADAADSAGFSREVLGLSAPAAADRARQRGALGEQRSARRVARGHRELALYAAPEEAGALPLEDRRSLALDPGAAVAYAAAEAVRAALEEGPGPLDAVAPAGAATVAALATSGAASSREAWLARVGADRSL